MGYIAENPESELGHVVGDGHCVAFVRQVAGAPASSLWSQGESVRGSDLPVGTVIATFQDGQYQNAVDGRSHAAIYLSQDAVGVWVYDQWKGQPVHKRLIRFRAGATTANNDGDAYSVVA